MTTFTTDGIRVVSALWWCRMSIGTPYIVVFEIATAVTGFLILLIQRPGVTTPQYAEKHGNFEVNQKRAEAANVAEARFVDDHAVARFILGRAGGFALWGGGLCVVIVYSPRVLNPAWIDSAIIGLGLAVQLVAWVLWVFWGLISARTISRAVDAVTEE